MAVHPEIRAILASTPLRWQQLIATVPGDLLRRLPQAGEWSALGCFAHIIATEELAFPARVRAILAGQDFAAFSPAAPAVAEVEPDAAEMVAQFTRSRTANLALYDTITAEDLSMTGRHADLGPMSLAEVIHSWAAHDLNHTIQAERSLMQPFISGSGALRFRFADHDVELKAR